jgi:hypothetical protein
MVRGHRKNWNCSDVVTTAKEEKGEGVSYWHWHFSDMPGRPGDVRSRGKSRHRKCENNHPIRG